MRLLAVVLVVLLAPIGQARGAAPALLLEGELPFTEAELRGALEPRLPDAEAPDARSIAVRAEGSQIVLELGARRATLALGAARGANAARLVAVALLDLMLAEPPPPAPDARLTEPAPAPPPASAPAPSTRATAPPVSRRTAVRDPMERAFTRLVVAPSLGIPSGALEPWTAVVSVGLGHVMAPALLEVDLEGWMAPVAERRGSFRSGWLALRARAQVGIGFGPIELLVGPALVPVWVSGGDGHHEVLFAIGGCARALLRLAPSLDGFATIGADVFPHRIELQAYDTDVIATPRIAPFLGLGIAWRIA